MKGKDGRKGWKERMEGKIGRKDRMEGKDGRKGWKERKEE